MGIAPGAVAAAAAAALAGCALGGLVALFALPPFVASAGAGSAGADLSAFARRISSRISSVDGERVGVDPAAMAEACAIKSRNFQNWAFESPSSSLYAAATLETGTSASVALSRIGERAAMSRYATAL